MISYEYRPTPQKKKEKTLVTFAFCAAVLLFAASYIPNVFLPWLFQVLAVAGFGFCICVASRYLLRSYSYRLEPSTLGDFLDLVIVEQRKSRLQTVCRIAVTDVESAERLTEGNKKQVLAKTQKSRVYRYQAQMEPTDHYLLTALENEERIYLVISADQGLIDGILSH